MKKVFFMLVTLLTFGAVSAQTDRNAQPTAPDAQKTEAVQPLKKADGRTTSPTAKNAVKQRTKNADGTMSSSAPDGSRNSNAPAAPGTSGATDTPLNAASNKSNQSPANNNAAPTR